MGGESQEWVEEDVEHELLGGQNERIFNVFGYEYEMTH